MRKEIERNLQLEFDELNQITYQAILDEVDFVEFTEQMMLYAYNRGQEDAEDMIDYLIDTVDLGKLDDAMNKRIDGMTYVDRLDAHLKNGGSITDLQRLVSNEYHRMYNQGALDAAEYIAQESGIKINKTWHTMLDDKVRDPHAYLEGQTVSLEDKFFTYGNESARYPSDFGVPELDINCRCWIEYGREGVFG